MAMPYSKWRSIEFKGWADILWLRIQGALVSLMYGFVDFTDAFFAWFERWPWPAKTPDRAAKAIGLHANGAAKFFGSFWTRVRESYGRVPGLQKFIARGRRQVLTAISLIRAEVVRRPWIMGAVSSALGLALIYGLDNLLGNPTGLRLLYILPIWIGTRLSGPIIGSFGVLGVGMVLAEIDLRDPASLGAFSPNNMMRYLALTLLMVVIAHVEWRLQTAKAQARLDPLTGVLNRTELQRRIQCSLDSMRRVGRPVALAVIDCDKFKEVNDTYGHAFGDYVLRVLARRLVNASRHQGVVGRVGGDEFVVLFEGLDYDWARHRMDYAEKSFCRLMQSLRCETTMSYGLAVANEDTLTPEQFIGAADLRMYAKKRGAVVAATDGVVAGEQYVTLEVQPRLL